MFKTIQMADMVAILLYINKSADINKKQNGRINSHFVIMTDIVIRKNTKWET